MRCSRSAPAAAEPGRCCGARGQRPLQRGQSGVAGQRSLQRELGVLEVNARRSRAGVIERHAVTFTVDFADQAPV